MKACRIEPTQHSTFLLAGDPLRTYVELAIRRAYPECEFVEMAGSGVISVPGDAALLTQRFLRALGPRPSARALSGLKDFRVTHPWKMAWASQILNLRTLKRLSQNGVWLEDPTSIVIGPRVQVEAGARIEGQTRLTGATRIGAGAWVKWGTVAHDAEIGPEALVGPYAHLRPGTRVGRGCKIGNFVELKESTIGEGTSVAHLSYLGDATVGSNVNIGCGFVTCNFDGRTRGGRRKHPTIIEDEVFMGSDCQTVAPLRVGRGAYVASGSTLTQDVPADSLAVARSRQENKLGYAARLRPKR